MAYPDDDPREINCLYTMKDVNNLIERYGQESVAKALLYANTYMIDTYRMCNVMIADSGTDRPEIRASYYANDGTLRFYMVGLWDESGQHFAFHS